MTVIAIDTGRGVDFLPNLVGSTPIPSFPPPLTLSLPFPPFPLSSPPLSSPYPSIPNPSFPHLKKST